MYKFKVVVLMFVRWFGRQLMLTVVVYSEINVMNVVSFVRFNFSRLSMKHMYIRNGVFSPHKLPFSIITNINLSYRFRGPNRQFRKLRVSLNISAVEDNPVFL